MSITGEIMDVPIDVVKDDRQKEKRKQTFAEKREADVRKRIVNDLKDHTITVRHCDGMYRHYRCQKPGTSSLYFDIVTWPGSLCFTGDMGEFVFQRTEDMIAFMRGSCMSYSYAAEKCVAHDGRLKEFCEASMEDVLRAELKERKTFTVHILGGKEERSVAEAVEVIRRAYREYSLPSDAEKAMYESGLWDSCDLPSCKEYTYHFLWCLHAIHWFCGKVEGA